jgi:outer membrane biosynthesis protein TonB
MEEGEEEEKEEGEKDVGTHDDNDELEALLESCLGFRPLTGEEGSTEAEAGKAEEQEEEEEEEEEEEKEEEEVLEEEEEEEEEKKEEEKEEEDEDEEVAISTSPCFLDCYNDNIIQTEKKNKRKSCNDKSQPSTLSQTAYKLATMTFE